MWDDGYIESSWIGQWGQDHLPIIPKVQGSIDTYFPDTKLAITEFNYGGEDHISGGIAIADVLGIFGKYGVDYAMYWNTESQTDYTINGKHVTELFNEHQYKGKHSIRVNCNRLELSTGIYLVRLQSNSESIIKPFYILK